MIKGGTIESNRAHIGVVFATCEFSVTLLGTIISNNTANRALIYILQSVGYLSNVQLADNKGSIFIYYRNL